MENSTLKVRLWFSYILQGIVVLFLLMGAINNIMKTEVALASSKELGYSEKSLLPLAFVLLFGIVCYAIPRGSIFGAVILTAWFGGAVATHIIHGDDFSTIILPVVFAIIVWATIGLRNKKVQSIILLEK
ncbi:MAG: DoxX family protein [Chitinophagaceae bacterium]